MKTLFVWLAVMGFSVSAVSAQQSSAAISEKEKKELAANCKIRVEKQPSISLPAKWIGKNERYRGGPTIRFTLFEDESIHYMKLVKSSGVKKLDECGLKVIRESKYKPMPGCPGLDTIMTVLIHLSD